MRLFDTNAPFWQFMNRMADQFLLSLLWMLFSLPLVTFGAASAAYIEVSMEVHKDENGGLTRLFFATFRKSFRRSTCIWFTMLLVGAVVSLDLRLCWMMDNAPGYFFLPVLVVLGALFLMVSFFALPLSAKCSDPLKQVWKTSGRLMISYMPYALSMLVLAVLGIFAALAFPSIIILLPAVVFYQYARVYVWVFERDEGVRRMIGQDT